MTMSFARASRPTTRVLGLGVAAVTAALLLGGCASGTTAGSTPTPTPTATDVEVIKQTDILLVTAVETLQARGLVVEYADATGQGRAIEDLNDWVVVTQDPITGTVPEGTVVTLTARMTTDPRM
jgi:PBP1b-binding outer membrane lipoprotein LpoB